MDKHFPDNYFFRQYKLLVMRSQNYKYVGYTESHHIFPKALFGNQNNDDIVVFDYKHHIIAHYLIWRGFQIAYGNSDIRTEKAKRAVYSMKVRIGRHKQKLTQLLLAKKACGGETFKHSEETKKRISDKLKGRPCTNAGILHSRESIEKGAITRSGLNHPKKAPVRCIETGEIFPLMSWAARHVNRDPANIIEAINKGTRCGGYHWERVLQETNSAIGRILYPCLESSLDYE